MIAIPKTLYFCWKLEQLLGVSASFAAFGLICFSALADRRAPHRQSHLVLLVSSADRSLDQSFIRQLLAGHAVDKAIEPCKRVVLYVSFVKAEGEFVNISTEMLLARVMINSDQAALEDGKDAFDAVSGDGTAHELACAMVDRIVVEGKGLNPVIRSRFVCMQGRSVFNMLTDCGLYGFLVGAADRHGLGPAAALAHPKDRGLADRTASSLKLLGFVLVLFDPADEGLVNFDDASELAKVGTAAGFPQTMQDEPSRLLRDPDFLGKLHRRNALPRRYKQVHRIDPLMQGDVAALENRPGAHRKVLSALVAPIEAPNPRRNPIAHTADGATRAIRPKPPFEVGPGGLLVREHLEKLEC
jgi:hypothetical protein